MKQHLEKESEQYLKKWRQNVRQKIHWAWMRVEPHAGNSGQIMLAVHKMEPQHDRYTYQESQRTANTVQTKYMHASKTTEVCNR